MYHLMTPQDIYSNKIFVSLLSDFVRISWPLKGLTAWKFLYHFWSILSRNSGENELDFESIYSQFIVNFIEFHWEFGSILADFLSILP